MTKVRSGVIVVDQVGDDLLNKAIFCGSGGYVEHLTGGVMNFTHSPEQKRTLADRCAPDLFEVVLQHLITIESKAAAQREAARRDDSRDNAQLSLFERQLKLF